MNRRKLLQSMAAAAAGSYMVSCGKADPLPAKRRLANVGIQLYSVRDRMAAGVPATLQQLAEIGYREVEFAGYYDYSPAEIVRLLDDNGLTSPSTHVPMVAVRDTPDQVVDSALSVGHEYVILSSVVREERGLLDDFRRHAELMNRFGEKCRSAGLKFAYHNHAYEFERLDGVRPMDLLLADTDPELLQIQLDIYWIYKANADPFEYFAKHPGRFPSCHVKDMADDGSITDVGAGHIDFAALFAASDRAGFRHYLVEHDNPHDSMASAASSFAALSRIEF